MKEDFSVSLTKDADGLFARYHYMGTSFGNYVCGLYYKDELVGGCGFHEWKRPEEISSKFGITTDEFRGFWELGRFVVHPKIQSFEHNISSWFISRSLSMLRKDHKVRAVFTVTDDRMHTGIMYAASNFVYYGEEPLKEKDSWLSKNYGGLHVFMKIYDKTLKCRWESVPFTNKHRHPLFSA